MWCRRWPRRLRKRDTATKTAYEEEAARKGWQNNIAGGLTFFTVTAIVVYWDIEEPGPEAVQSYFKAVNTALDEIPEFATVANKDKQGFNNMLVGFSGLMIAGYMEGKQNNDAARLCLKSPNPLLETVSTTCGSGWVRSFYACIENLRRRTATHPPATAGGTDCLQPNSRLLRQSYAATLASYKKLSRMLVEMVLKTDLENIRVEGNQIVMK